MNKAAFLFYLVFVILYTGCTAVSEPTPTLPSPTAVASAELVIAERRSPTPTAIERVETATPPTATSSPVATETHAPIPDAVAKTAVVWTDTLQEVLRVNTNSIVWSPVANEFLFAYCPGPGEFNPSDEQVLFLSAAPNFQPLNLTPANYACPSEVVSISLLWHPGGETFLITGLLAPLPEWVSDDAYVWLMAKDGQNSQLTDIGGRYLHVAGWMDERTITYNTYAGGGVITINLLDMETGSELAWAMIHAGYIHTFDDKYVASGTGVDPNFFYTAAVISTDVVSPESLDRQDGSGPFLRLLSSGGQTRTVVGELFNSRFEDWLFNQHQMLVLTWGEGISLANVNLAFDDPVTDLQVWDVESGQLTLLAPGSVYGRFSPDGRFVAFITHGRQAPFIQLLDRMRDEVLFSSPVAVRETDSGYQVYAETTFSPDNHYLTFFKPEPDAPSVGEALRLEVYDLVTRQFSFSLPALRFMPVWSPDSSRFVYMDAGNYPALFDVGNGRSLPLTLSNGGLFFNPQWSFDSTYLSIGIRGEHEWRETAVLRLPAP